MHRTSVTAERSRCPAQTFFRYYRLTSRRADTDTDTDTLLHNIYAKNSRAPIAIA